MTHRIPGPRHYTSYAAYWREQSTVSIIGFLNFTSTMRAAHVQRKLLLAGLVLEERGVVL